MTLLPTCAASTAAGKYRPRSSSGSRSSRGSRYPAAVSSVGQTTSMRKASRVGSWARSLVTSSAWKAPAEGGASSTRTRIPGCRASKAAITRTQASRWAGFHMRNPTPSGGSAAACPSGRTRIPAASALLMNMADAPSPPRKGRLPAAFRDPGGPALLDHLPPDGFPVGLGPAGVVADFGDDPLSGRGLDVLEVGFAGAELFPGGVEHRGRVGRPEGLFGFRGGAPGLGPILALDRVLQGTHRGI